MKTPSDFEFIEKIIFINLDRRTDRLKDIQEELKFLEPTKVIRFKAIEEADTRIACAKSHVGVLKYAREHSFKNVLILEDDSTWNTDKYKEAVNALKQLIHTNPKYDVINLGGFGAQLSYDKNTYRLYKCWGTHAYLVNSHYYDKLIHFWEQSIYSKKFEPIDESWTQLMKTDKFYLVVPALMFQKPGYSDLHASHMDFKNTYEMFEFFDSIGIL